MLLPELQDFALVGGTCLSLRYGHRKSIDLDLFASTDFDVDQLIKNLEQRFDGFSVRSSRDAIGVFGFIDQVKIDLIKYHHFDKIGKQSSVDGIRMYSDADLMAMKIFAILKRAQKKDFWDIAELLKHYNVLDFIDCYNKKFPNHRVLISIPQAMIYFADAEESEDPVSLKGQTWESVKKSISQKVSDYLK